MYLPDDILALTDRVGMHHSLELRVPFVDHEVVEYCARIPSALKIRGLNKKHLLKKASGKLLPKSVIDHRKPRFCSPMAAWLRGDLKPLVAEALDQRRVAREGIFAPEAVARLERNHFERNQFNDKIIFSLLVFDRWLTRRRMLKTSGQERAPHYVAG